MALEVTLPILDVQVPPDAFPFLVIGTLEVMRRGELDFYSEQLATLRPSAGRLGLSGEDRYEAAVQIRKWLDERAVPSSAIPRP